MFAPCALGELAEDEVLGVFIGTGRIVGAGPATSERGSGLRDLKGGGQMKREALASALSVERARRLGPAYAVGGPISQNLGDSLVTPQATQ